MSAAAKGQVALQKGLVQMIPELVKCIGSIARDADSVKAGDVTYTIAEEVIRILLALMDQTTDTASESEIYQCHRRMLIPGIRKKRKST